ncbi:putative tubulin polyglutamylase TTLL9 [Taenia crassiceps]|uniref:Tubulin polyglutamylase TTLL9 n=1 Tax=Taenia crassiceps TaxID=6207 RepID=A0ABR4QMY0_9CEST
MQSTKVISRKDPELKSPIKFRCSFNNTIRDVLRNRGWQELGPEDENFDFFWCTIEWMRDNFDHKYLADHVRLCHFRNHFELTRKNLMVRNLKRAKKKIEKETGCRNMNT